MNRERAKELLPIIQAFAEGKTIQAQNRRPQTSNDWVDAVDEFLFFDSNDWNWRIKPEPREWFVYSGNDEPIITDSPMDVDAKYAHKWIKVREVLE